MKITTRLMATLCAVLLFGGGCTTWKPADGEAYTDKKKGFSYIQQENWYRSPFRARGFLTLTKDGPDLQYIILGRKLHKDAFKQIEKESSPSDLPQELAENFVADLKSSLNLDVIEILENSPATVGGFPGFKLEMAYRTDEGLRYQERIYGAATENGFYTIEYRAPVLHYYDRDLASFEATKETFQIVPIESKKR